MFFFNFNFLFLIVFKRLSNLFICSLSFFITYLLIYLLIYLLTYFPALLRNNWHEFFLFMLWSCVLLLGQQAYYCIADPGMKFLLWKPISNTQRYISQVLGLLSMIQNPEEILFQMINLTTKKNYAWHKSKTHQQSQKTNGKHLWNKNT